jgi:adenylate kinase family enzyme
VQKALSQLVTLFGRPGSGKTELGDWLAREHGFLHVALGRVLNNPTMVQEIGLDQDIVRKALASGRTIDEPRLVEWIDVQIAGSDRPVVVDGYPRVQASVEPFNQLVEGRLAGWSVFALHLVCDTAVAAARVARRGRDGDRSVRLDDRNDEYERVQLPLLDRLTDRTRIVAIDAGHALDDVRSLAATAISLHVTSTAANVKEPR